MAGKAGIGNGVETMYDQRLFNQSRGMDSGFGADDGYNVYSKPLFAKKSASIYKPKTDNGPDYGDVEDMFQKIKDTSKFKPHKGFAGASDSARGNKPVQFEK
eukprot:g4026.t1